jgi:hypothetical protein
MIKKKNKLFSNFDLKLKLDKNITLHYWMILFSREFSSRERERERGRELGAIDP